MTAAPVEVSRPRTWIPVAAWTAIATVLLVVQRIGPTGGRPRSLLPLGPHLQGWVQFDGPEYLAIATQGYQARQLVWFPAYPLLLRALDAALGDAVLAGVLITLAAGLASAVLFWRWLGRSMSDPVVRATALATLLLYPYGWFLYGVVYSDALFLALALGAFCLVERDQPVAAGLVAAVATATRPSGFAVAIGVLVLAVERAGVLDVDEQRTDGWLAALRLPTRVRPDRWRAALAGPLLAWLGLAAYGTYQWLRWGSPVRFLSEQQRYHDSGQGTFVKQQYFESWSQGYDGRHLATTTAQAVVLVVVLGTVPAIGRRFGWGYAVFVAGLATFPAATVATFMGTGRYLLPAFPFFALTGEWLARRPVLRVAYLSVCATLLIVMAYGFSRSWYLT